MRFVSLVIFAAACGGSNKPGEPQEPQPKPAARRPSPNFDAAPEAKVLGDASLQRRAPPPPPPKPDKPPLPPIYDRLHDDDGAVPGLTGFSMKRVRNPTRCGGFSILVKRGKKIAPTDAKLAALYALEFPLDLDFSETKKAGSLLKFNTWIETMSKTAGAAKTQYEADFVSTDPAVKVAATARLAQVFFRAASLVARAARCLRTSGPTTRRTS